MMKSILNVIPDDVMIIIWKKIFEEVLYDIKYNVLCSSPHIIYFTNGNGWYKLHD